MNNRMIFHYPFPLPEKATSGSQVRLVSILAAFEAFGYDVEVIAGYADERRKAIQGVKREIEQGRQFAFVYSESSTLPTLLSKRNFYRPFLDFAFFRYCNNHAIPVGFFYRDIYWRFKQFRMKPWYRHIVALLFYKYDWLNYARYTKHLFLPSLTMKDVLPDGYPAHKISALPPGCSIAEEVVSVDCQWIIPEPGALNLLYVGGVQPPFYDLKPMLKVVNALDGVFLTLCCRVAEWQQVQSYYAPIDYQRVQVVHTSGQGLVPYYKCADVFVLIRQPDPYLDFAMPVKLFEALGHAVPIVTTAGTEVAHFVAHQDIGWVVKTKDELRSLLIQLHNSRDEIAAKQVRMLAIREQHTWQSRARQVAETLKSIR